MPGPPVDPSRPRDGHSPTYYGSTELNDPPIKDGLLGLPSGSPSRRGRWRNQNASKTQRGGEAKEGPSRPWAKATPSLVPGPTPPEGPNARGQNAEADHHHPTSDNHRRRVIKQHRELHSALHTLSNPRTSSQAQEMAERESRGVTGDTDASTAPRAPPTTNAHQPHGPCHEPPEREGHRPEEASGDGGALKPTHCESPRPKTTILDPPSEKVMTLKGRRPTATKTTRSQVASTKKSASSPQYESQFGREIRTLRATRKAETCRERAQRAPRPKEGRYEFKSRSNPRHLKMDSKMKKELWEGFTSANKKRLVHVSLAKTQTGSSVDWSELEGLKIPDVVTSVPSEWANGIGAEGVAASIVGLLGEQDARSSDVMTDSEGTLTGEIIIRVTSLSADGARRLTAGKWKTKEEGSNPSSTRGFFIHKSTVIGTAAMPLYSTAPGDENWFQVRWVSLPPNKPDRNQIYKVLETHIKEALLSTRGKEFLLTASGEEGTEGDTQAVTKQLYARGWLRAQERFVHATHAPFGRMDAEKGPNNMQLSHGLAKKDFSKISKTTPTAWKVRFPKAFSAEAREAVLTAEVELDVRLEIANHPFENYALRDAIESFKRGTAVSRDPASPRGTDVFRADPKRAMLKILSMARPHDSGLMHPVDVCDHLYSHCGIKAIASIMQDELVLKGNAAPAMMSSYCTLIEKGDPIDMMKVANPQVSWTDATTMRAWSHLDTKNGLRANQDEVFVADGQLSVRAQQMKVTDRATSPRDVLQQATEKANQTAVSRGLNDSAYEDRVASKFGIAASLKAQEQEEELQDEINFLEKKRAARAAIQRKKMQELEDQIEGAQDKQPPPASPKRNREETMRVRVLDARGATTLEITMDPGDVPHGSQERPSAVDLAKHLLEQHAFGVNVGVIASELDKKFNWKEGTELIVGLVMDVSYIPDHGEIEWSTSSADWIVMVGKDQAASLRKLTGGLPGVYQVGVKAIKKAHASTPWASARVTDPLQSPMASPLKSPSSKVPTHSLSPTDNCTSRRTDRPTSSRSWENRGQQTWSKTSKTRCRRLRKRRGRSRGFRKPLTSPPSFGKSTTRSTRLPLKNSGEKSQKRARACRSTSQRQPLQSWHCWDSIRRSWQPSSMTKSRGQEKPSGEGNDRFHHWNKKINKELILNLIQNIKSKSMTTGTYSQIRRKKSKNKKVTRAKRTTSVVLFARSQESQDLNGHIKSRKTTTKGSHNTPNGVKKVSQRGRRWKVNRKVKLAKNDDARDAQEGDREEEGQGDGAHQRQAQGNESEDRVRRQSPQTDAEAAGEGGGEGRGHDLPHAGIHPAHRGALEAAGEGEGEGARRRPRGRRGAQTEPGPCPTHPRSQKPTAANQQLRARLPAPGSREAVAPASGMLQHECLNSDNNAFNKSPYHVDHCLELVSSNRDSEGGERRLTPEPRQVQRQTAGQEGKPTRMRIQFTGAHCTDKLSIFNSKTRLGKEQHGTITLSKAHGPGRAGSSPTSPLSGGLHHLVSEPEGGDQAHEATHWPDAGGVRSLLPQSQVTPQASCLPVGAGTPPTKVPVQVKEEHLAGPRVHQPTVVATCTQDGDIPLGQVNGLHNPCRAHDPEGAPLCRQAHEDCERVSEARGVLVRLTDDIEVHVLRDRAQAEDIRSSSANHVTGSWVSLVQLLDEVLDEIDPRGTGVHREQRLLAIIARGQRDMIEAEPGHRDDRIAIPSAVQPAGEVNGRAVAGLHCESHARPARPPSLNARRQPPMVLEGASVVARRDKRGIPVAEPAVPLAARHHVRAHHEANEREWHVPAHKDRPNFVQTTEDHSEARVTAASLVKTVMTLVNNKNLGALSATIEWRDQSASARKSASSPQFDDDSGVMTRVNRTLARGTGATIKAGPYAASARKSASRPQYERYDPAVMTPVKSGNYQATTATNRDNPCAASARKSASGPQSGPALNEVKKKSGGGGAEEEQGEPQEEEEGQGPRLGRANKGSKPRGAKGNGGRHPPHTQW